MLKGNECYYCETDGVTAMRLNEEFSGRFNDRPWRGHPAHRLRLLIRGQRLTDTPTDTDRYRVWIAFEVYPPECNEVLTQPPGGRVVVPIPIETAPAVNFEELRAFWNRAKMMYLKPRVGPPPAAVPPAP